MPEHHVGKKEEKRRAPAWVAALAGLLAASVAALRLRPDAGFSANKLLLHAVMWVLMTALAGTSAMWIAEVPARRWRSRPFRVDALEAAAAWLLLPPLWLLAGRESRWTLAFAAGVAGVLAVCLRGMIPMTAALSTEREPDAGPRFAELPATDSEPGQAFAIAVCAECAVVLTVRHDLMAAMLVTGVAAFVFVWKRLTMALRERGTAMKRPAARAAAAAVLALLLVVPLLLVQLARMGPVVGGAAAAETTRKPAQRQGEPADGYRGIILFARRDKTKELPPVPQEGSPVWSGTRKPRIIPFDGAYWYFQAPRQGPGLHPHVARGDPVKVSIYSTGWMPLAMQGHQQLAQAVELRGCGAIGVTVENGDNRPGRIDLGVLLTDSSLPGKPSLFLGTRPIVSTEAGHFAFKASPLDEEVTFAIPARGGLKSFDAITVFFFPAEERATLGARIGIEQFELKPR